MKPIIKGDMASSSCKCIGVELMKIHTKVSLNFKFNFLKPSSKTKINISSIIN